MLIRDALPGLIIQGTARGRYHLRELLGEGGQGWVYKATYDDPEGFFVVVKVLRPECVNAESLGRFTREAEVLRRLGMVPNPNPNIVRFYDYAVFPSPSSVGPREIPFIALEYVPGHTFGRRDPRPRGVRSPRSFGFAGSCGKWRGPWMPS